MRRPNIVYIVADDLGFADLGCYGGRAPVSPRLDGLALEGLRFTEGYANAPVCSPTRFALMTGRWQYRLRGAADEPMGGNARGSTTLGLPPGHPTLPSLLKAAGYRTALVGKWHMGYLPHFGPLKSGYERFYGAMSGGLDYWTHADFRGVHDLWEGEQASHDIGYLTDLISRRSVATIDEWSSGDAPWFLSVHYTAPHWPWETRDDAAVAAEVHGKLFHLGGGSVSTYHRMISHMDEGVGWILEAVERSGRAEDTIVLFTSDNGGERFSDNWPLVGGKMDLTEGGIRVPWIVRWPAVVAPAAESRQLCMTMDWTATLLTAAGASADPVHPLDGTSLLPVLRDPATCVIDIPLYWRMKHRGQRALRRGRWKYLRVDGHDYLFDLVADARERANRSLLEPERLAVMRDDWEAWNATMPEIPADAVAHVGYSEKDMPQR